MIEYGQMLEAKLKKDLIIELRHFIPNLVDTRPRSCSFDINTQTIGWRIYIGDEETIMPRLGYAGKHWMNFYSNDGINTIKNIAFDNWNGEFIIEKTKENAYVHDPGVKRFRAVFKRERFGCEFVGVFAIQNYESLPRDCFRIWKLIKNILT